MQIDAITLAAVADELRSELVGARVDDVIQPTPQAVALQCYGGGRNRWLLASAHPQFARLHTVDQKPRKLAAEPPTFVMLLRKYLEGTRLRDVRQPRWERLVELGFARAQLAEPVWLVVEVMGQISNVILKSDDGIILGALRLVGPEQNRYRTIAPHVPYRYPPPQTRTLHGETLPRLEPERVSGRELAQAAADAGAVAAKSAAKRKDAPSIVSVLTGHVAGWSRDLAAEAAACAELQPHAPPATDVPWEQLANAVRELAALADRGEWAPTLVYEGDGHTVRDAAVYRPRRFGDAPLRAAESVNGLLAAYFEGVEWRGALDAAKSGLRRTLEAQRERCHRKAAALASELGALEEASQLRLEADTLLAFQADVPVGARSFSMDNPFAAAPDDPPTLTIALDPSLNAVQNANRLYARYHKLQRAG
jgi:predicted ribosome quality control (RQC) complex YloA/Tae2 family protein